MSRAPLFASEGSVYRRTRFIVDNVDEDDDEEEYHVDISLPSTPKEEYRFQAGPSQAGPSTHTRSTGSTSQAWKYAMQDEQEERPRNVAFPVPEPVPQVKAEEVSDSDDGRAEEDDPPLREVREEDGDYARIGVDPVGEVEEEDGPDERQCRICFMGAEEEEAMGRLISPCLCAGTMRFVHVNCINAWRGTGTNSRAFMECPQCHHRYRLQRTLISGLATSRPLLLALSTILFLTITLLAGQLVHYLILRPSSTSKGFLKPRVKTSLWSTLRDEWDDWDDDGGIIVIGGGGALIYDVVLGAVQTFAAVANKFINNNGGNGWANALPGPIHFLIFALGVRFLLGLAVLGSLSFLSLLLSMSLFAPLQIANGLRGGIFNFGRRNGRLRQDGTSTGQIVIIVFVLIGALNTLRQVYNLTERITHKMLRYVETTILEVNPDDRARARRVQKWWKRWVREQRYTTIQGWQEVGFRLRLWAQEALGPIWDRVWSHGREEVGGEFEDVPQLQD